MNGHLVSIQGQMIALQVRVEAMKAANAKWSALGKTPVYGEKAFNAIGEQLLRLCNAADTLAEQSGA
jgi:hypothetical protein